ncbi:MAG: SCO family protein [Verrucomicrobiae bacterium]|nr:SCO family protein [Verrucomicrobiae bacterium]
MPTFQLLAVTFFLAATVGLVSCGNEETGGPGKTKRFHVRGVVQKAMPGDPSMMIIDHEEIPGYMPRMIMPFHARDPEEFVKLEPGMVVTFDYHVSGEESWVTGVKPTGETGALTLDERRPDDARLARPGDHLPEVAFLDETGAEVRISDFKGMPVALTFVFSRCPVPEYCPRMMNQFAEVIEAMKTTAGAPPTYRLLTISFDHEHDRPEVLKAWAAAFGFREGMPWSLLSSEDPGPIEALAVPTGLRYGEANGTIQHNLRTLVLNPDGTIRRLFNDETWTPAELVSELVAASKHPAKPDDQKP